MSKGKGTSNMQNEEGAKAGEADAKAPRIEVKNEFAPNVVGEGKDARVVDPAPSPEPGELAAAAPTPAAAEAADDAEDDAAEEADFLDYVHGSLKRIADRLGYDLVLKKRSASRGPIMLYHRDDKHADAKGKVFNSREEAGPDYMSGDEWRERNEARRAAE